MFGPIYIKTPEGNFINLAFIYAIKKSNQESKFCIIFLTEKRENSSRIEFNTEEERDEFCSRIENLVCSVI